MFPGRGSVIWRDWYTHDVVKSNSGSPTTLSAPLGHINVHIRDGSALLLHAAPAYTVEETQQGPYSLLVSQSAQGLAHGTAYIDDGISNPPGPSSVLTFSANKQSVNVKAQGSFKVAQPLQDITVLGVSKKPTSVLLNGRKVQMWTYAPQQAKLVALSVNANLNQPLTLTWS